MDPLNVAKSALKTVWTHKVLWVFGFFVAGAAAGGSARAGGNHGTSSPFPGVGSLPGWVVGLVAAGVGFALLGILIHVICDAALVDGVRRARTDEPVTFSLGVRAGAASFWRLARVKLLSATMILGGASVLAVPGVLKLIGLVSLPAAIALAALAALAVFPMLLSIWFMSAYATRISVLESKGALQAFREAKLFLSGRIRDSLMMLLVAFAGQAAGALVALVMLVPAAVVGAVVYFAAGLVPALVAAGVLAVPAVTVVVGASGAFQSAVWTTAYLEGRAEEAR